MDREDPVFICSGCGRGFLRYCEVDVTPVWGWTAEIKSGGPCGGIVVTASRAIVTRNLDRMEMEDAHRNDQTDTAAG